jgi:hypothetical protein
MAPLYWRNDITDQYPFGLNKEKINIHLDEIMTTHIRSVEQPRNGAPITV